MIEQQDLIRAIEQLGLKDAEVCIHASLRSFGEPVNGGAKTITDAFLSCGCTILAPAFTYHYQVKPIPPYMPQRNGAGDYTYFLNGSYDDTGQIFSITGKDISTQEMGLLPEYILSQQESHRGNHPLNSFTAIGPKAKKLTENQNPTDLYASFRTLTDDNGFVLLMGIGLDKATIIHYAEQLAGRTPFMRWALDKAYNVIPVFTGGCSDGFENFEGILKNTASEIEVGKSLWRCYKAKDITRLCANEIIRNPHITHCANSQCDRCNDALLGGPVLNN